MEHKYVETVGVIRTVWHDPENTFIPESSSTHYLDGELPAFIEFLPPARQEGEPFKIGASIVFQDDKPVNRGEQMVRCVGRAIRKGREGWAVDAVVGEGA